MKVVLVCSYRLPRMIVTGLSRFFAYAGYWLNSKNSQTVLTNLKLCFPALEKRERRTLARQVVAESALMYGEVVDAWMGSKQEIESKIFEINGQNILEECRQAEKPIIVAVPHIGNWEYFWHWLQLNYTAISMYSPAKFDLLDEVMFKARTKFGGKPFATDPKGIMGLLRALKKGGIMMILPDQAPREGAGVYTPFFGYPAYTMTLLHKFIGKTGAQLLFGSCIRLKDGKGFSINIEKADFPFEKREIDPFNLAMNQQIEKIIERNPEQYQWSYKRFKRQSNGITPYQ
ncbi:lysophospholipid acyltransferase family protein [Aliikangiella coralliicola]|uniref:Lipid A biosynthesis acyltransferase n=1 Tax=Aliikangiella coralliicola TaxID=2592383 RepID=A0A545UGU1_9GAMM|nr:lysophospholipid acyltransferase family protein [Aliikangiella coralliicola]TQV88623.1 hypothetical protein FLL46_08905 [Aliikangiella coralliicola]